MLPGSRWWDVLGAASSHSTVDAMQRILLHWFEIRDARRDLRANRNLLHAIVFVTGAELNIWQVSIGLGMALALTLIQIRIRILAVWLTRTGAGLGGDGRVAYRSGARYRCHHRTTAAGWDLCKIIAGRLLGDTVEAWAGWTRWHPAAAMATWGWWLQELMMGRLVWCHSLRGIPFQAAL